MSNCSCIQLPTRHKTAVKKSLRISDTIEALSISLSVQSYVNVLCAKRLQFSLSLLYLLILSPLLVLLANTAYIFRRESGKTFMKFLKLTDSSKSIEATNRQIAETAWRRFYKDPKMKSEGTEYSSQCQELSNEVTDNNCYAPRFSLQWN